jgi:hypothetical protein
MADTKETNHRKLCTSASATTSGPHANATVTRREEYRRIGAKHTRLLPNISLLRTGTFAHLLTVLPVMSELIRYDRHERRIIKTLPTHKSFAENVRSEPEGLFQTVRIDRTYFGRVERGERNLTFSSLCQICAGLNCDTTTVTEGIPHLADAPK